MPRQRYQLVNAYIAISRGGLSWPGIGQSSTKQEGLYCASIDYILAVIGEESGLVALVVVVLLLSALDFPLFPLGSQESHCLPTRRSPGLAICS